MVIVITFSLKFLKGFHNHNLDLNDVLAQAIPVNFFILKTIEYMQKKSLKKTEKHHCKFDVNFCDNPDFSAKITK